MQQATSKKQEIRQIDGMPHQLVPATPDPTKQLMTYDPSMIGYNPSPKQQRFLWISRYGPVVTNSDEAATRS